MSFPAARAGKPVGVLLLALLTSPALTGCEPATGPLAAASVADTSAATTTAATVPTAAAAAGTVGGPTSSSHRARMTAAARWPFRPPAPPAPPPPPAPPGPLEPTIAVGEPTAPTTPGSTISPRPTTPVPGVTPSASPVTGAGPCPPLYGPETPLPVSVSAGAAPVISWWHPGDPSTVAYWIGVQVGAASGGSPTAAISWTKVIPPAGCREVSLPVPGLAPHTTYTLVFDLESTIGLRAGTFRATRNRIMNVVVP